MPEREARPRRAGILARDQRDRRRLRPLRPDRRADADGQAHPGDPDRQRSRADRASPSEFGTKVYYGDGTRHRPAAPGRGGRGRGDPVLPRRPRARPATSWRRCSRRSRRPRSWSGSSTGAQVIELDGLDIALIQREMFESAVVMGREALHRLRHRRARGRPGRARISRARQRAARAAERDRRLARRLETKLRRRPTAGRRAGRRRPSRAARTGARGNPRAAADRRSWRRTPRPIRRVRISVRPLRLPSCRRAWP